MTDFLAPEHVPALNGSASNGLYPPEWHEARDNGLTYAAIRSVRKLWVVDVDTLTTQDVATGEARISLESQKAVRDAVARLHTAQRFQGKPELDLSGTWFNLGYLTTEQDARELASAVYSAVYGGPIPLTRIAAGGVV
ncbi:hypothetical protein OG594_46100 [Streptomyces sp. NBC_01214]|uniref:hypothetical protein n=1 Tax=Streptomyces sp. NBC_01214 TaxID=2903777 RepID=UPI0022559F2E|nr:hypothetical protein [Streptomyces sp. NBC_01214]MCX4808838.1 hypothetical protein [Streptomyces sp. NBC_01214]